MENTIDVLLCLLKWYNAAVNFIKSFCGKRGKVALST